MLAFEITGDTVKAVMNALLKGSAFDDFYVRGVEICAVTKFEISGLLDKSFLEEETARAYCFWKELKRYAFELIKGNQKPKSVRVIFSLPEEAALAIHENAAALFLNLTFTGEKINFTAVTSQKNFSLDKTMDLRWEEYIRDFFQAKGWAVSTHN